MGLDEVSGADFWCKKICATSPIDLARFRLDLAGPKILDFWADPQILDFSADPQILDFSVEPMFLHFSGNPENLGTVW